MWKSALRYSALGLEMGISAAIGYGAGWWLDKKFGTKPYLTLVMILLGIAAGFLSLYRTVKAINLDNDSNGDSTRK